MRVLLVFIHLVLIMGCQLTPAPIEEYALARAALDAARAVQSQKYSPGFFHKAEDHYRLGRSEYKERNYSEARDQFVKARQTAEKAENSTRLLRQRNGDVL